MTGVVGRFKNKKSYFDTYPDEPRPPAIKTQRNSRSIVKF